MPGVNQLFHFASCICFLLSNVSAELQNSGRLLETSEEFDDMLCEVEMSAFHDCVTNNGTVTMQAIDCALCPTTANIKLAYFPETIEQRDFVCDGLRSDNYCEGELHECVSERCPDECHEKVVAYADCASRLSGCELDCKSILASSAFKPNGMGITVAFGVIYWMQADRRFIW
mmetsp:Transcript_22476/g.54370  ORF Transcript_22476/g.54370 Transcript_22476/m.54370 type:complete len:173 (+) Transcript_22476:66-584(+)